MELNAITYIYMSYGIPIVYYGTEAKLAGGDDPMNREVFDPYKTKLDQTMTKYIRILNRVRKEYTTYDFDPEFRLVDPNLMIMSKGPDVLVLLTNTENVYQAAFTDKH
jgi:glycosidase